MSTSEVTLEELQLQASVRPGCRIRFWGVGKNVILKDVEIKEVLGSGKIQTFTVQRGTIKISNRNSISDGGQYGFSDSKYPYIYLPIAGNFTGGFLRCPSSNIHP